jgi:hypothetical protein
MRFLNQNKWSAAHWMCWLLQAVGAWTPTIASASWLREPETKIDEGKSGRQSFGVFMGTLKT